MREERGEKEGRKETRRGRLGRRTENDTKQIKAGKSGTREMDKVREKQECTGESENGRKRGKESRCMSVTERRGGGGGGGGGGE